MEKQTLDVLMTSRELDGVERLVQLYPATPNPADAFIPKEDALNLLLRFSITKMDRRKSRPIRALKKSLEPKIDGLTNCKVDYRISVSEGRNWFVIEYHVYDYEYGVALYNELKDRLFTDCFK